MTVFPFDFEPNRIPFGSKSKRKLSSRSYPFNVKGIGSIVFSVHVHYFPPTQIYLLGLGLGPSQVIVRIRIKR